MKPLAIITLILMFLILIGCSPKTKEIAFEDEIGKASPKDITLNSKVSELSPEDVAKSYYNALNNKDYATMHALISDGFKEIEETANTFESFEAYMSGFFDTAKGINVLSVEETSNDGKKARVDYTVELISLNGDTQKLESTFTIKKTSTGWKLIHPYGENVDESP